VLDKRMTGEWLLNYRAGSFLLPDRPEVRREAALRGVLPSPSAPPTSRRSARRSSRANMERIILEKAPRIAVYTPDNVNPWDDAVTLALDLRRHPVRQAVGCEVLQGRLGSTTGCTCTTRTSPGQYSKFYISYANAPWLQEAVRATRQMAAALQPPERARLKKAVAEEMRRYVAQGGFLFAMCTATETLELALAALGVDIAASVQQRHAHGSEATQKLQWDRTLAFRDAELQMNPA
jgi:hypothetical protein